MFFILTGCTENEDRKNSNKTESSPKGPQIKIDFQRFDHDLFGADFSDPDSAVQVLYQKYGSFYCGFIEDDLRLAPCQDPNVGKMLVPFINNQDIIETREEIEKIFPREKIEELNNELSGAFQRWHRSFPDSLTPKVVYYQSAWNSNISVTDSAIGISLDCYLGQHNKITQQLPHEIFSAYQKANMEERYIVSDAVKGWVSYKNKQYYKTGNLLNELVFYGKMMYITEALLPYSPDSLLMSWSVKQQKWAEENEWNVWKTLANEKVMFNTKPFEINKWFVDGPFTGATGVPQNSSPQLGVWFGWQMVRQYMKANPAKSLQELLQETDNNNILRAYKPKR